MSAITRTREVLYSGYGHLIRAEEPEFDKSRNVYVSKLVSNYPIMIRDDRENRRFIRRIHVPYLGKITLDDKLLLISRETTDYSDVNSQLQKFLDIWTDQAEQLVAKTTSDLIVQLPEVQTTFTPLRVLINRLWQNEVIKEKDIHYGRSKDRVDRHRKYLQLLEEIDMVKKVDNEWIPGPDFLKVRSKIESLPEGRAKILSIALQKRYSILKQVFDIGNFERIMKIENVVYLPETEENRQIFRDVKTIQSDLRWYYRGRVNPMYVQSTLINLHEIGAIDKEDNYFAGQESIRADIITEKARQPSLESRWLAAIA